MCLKEKQKITNEEVDEEIVKRMKILELHQNVIKDYVDEHKVNKSEGKYAVLYWLNAKEKNLVREFEKKNKHCIVYHVIKSNSNNMGLIYDLLYVSLEDKEFWEDERADLRQGYALSNTVTEFPETGLIRIEKVNGGVIRKC